jgi:hypothetical protein
VRAWPVNHLCAVLSSDLYSCVLMSSKCGSERVWLHTVAHTIPVVITDQPARAGSIVGHLTG